MFKPINKHTIADIEIRGLPLMRLYLTSKYEAVPRGQGCVANRSGPATKYSHDDFPAQVVSRNDIASVKQPM